MKLTAQGTRLVNGFPLTEVERVEGLVKDMGQRFGLSSVALESGRRYRQFHVMLDVDHTIGRPATLGEIEKMVNFAIAVHDEAMLAGMEEGDSPY